MEVLGFLAAKIVVPIVCAFIKDAVYKKYKKLQTKAAAEKAKQALLGSKGPFKLAVDREVLVPDMVQSLVSEGVDPEVAKNTVNQVIAYAETELAGPKP